MNDPAALAEALATRQDKKRIIQNKISNIAPQLASQLKTLRDLHSTRREALLYAITRLDEELAQSEATLTKESSVLEKNLREQLRDLKKQDKLDRRTMSVATLPDEMLACIFGECVNGDIGEPGGEGLGFSPRILALVNRKWYRVALGTASLWRTILVTDAISDYWEIKRNARLSSRTSSKHARTHSAMQVCTTEAELEGALRRTRGTTLEITITFGNNRLSYSSTSAPLYSELYRMLFNDRIAPRIAHLVLERGYMATMTAPLFNYIATNVHRLSNLVHLATVRSYSLHRTQDGKSMLQLVLENSKTLKYLSIIDGNIEDCLRPHVWQNAGHSSTILNLQQLRLGPRCFPDAIFSDNVPVSELIMEDTARVEQAGEKKMWEISPSPWPTRSTPRMNFMCLTRMHLISEDISLLSRLTFPVLDYLRLTQPSGSPSGATPVDIEPFFIPDFVVDLPKLRSLRITARHFAPVNRFNSPQLESFHMTSTHSMKGKVEADFLQLFRSPVPSTEPLVEGSQTTPTKPTELWFQNIHTLYINANVSERVLIQAFRLLPLLRVLKLVPGKKMAQVLVKELTVEKPKPPSKKNNIFCPALEVIELDLVSFTEWDKGLKMAIRVGTTTLDGLPNALIKCVASRQKAGIPLQRCTVISRAGQQEYVKYIES
jgi:hypothetical protein